MAVGIAAWSTYDAVNSYVGLESSALESQKAEEVRSGQEVDLDVSHQDGRSRQCHPGGILQPGRKAPPRQSGTMTQKPPPTPPPPRKPPEEVASQPTPAPESSQTEEQVPATAPLYEISTEMIWPIENGETLNAYSAGAPVYSKTMKDWRIHTGLDVAAGNEGPCAGLRQRRG